MNHNHHILDDWKALPRPITTFNKCRIVFVCLGNICRSATAEGILIDMLKKKNLEDFFVVDSAGTSRYHIGERPHSDTLAEAKRRRVNLPSRARQFKAKEFADWDIVVCMDESNLSDVRALDKHRDYQDKLVLMRDFESNNAARKPKGVPDPYFEGGFGGVFDICEDSCAGLLNELEPLVER